MQLLQKYELKITNGAIPLDDNSLLNKFNKLTYDVEEKKQVFNTCLSFNNSNDYLTVAVARLAYEFTKEEYESLYCEVMKRGLLQVS